MKFPTLGVNVDHVATVRQARGTRYPDPVAAAMAAELAGADQITVHLREDRRHIQDRDVRVLREVLTTRLNFEMAATDEMLSIARAVRPDMATVVPEKREERTTEGGLNVVAAGDDLRGLVEAMSAEGIVCSLFVDPDPTQLDACAALGVPVVELHTGDYAEARGGEVQRELSRIAMAAAHAHGLGLTVAAGHGLDYRNVAALCAIETIVEYNIGHSIVARALMVGFDQAVREMIAALRAGR